MFFFFYSPLKDLWGADIKLKLSEQFCGEGREDLSERCRIVAEGRENSHCLRRTKEALTLQ